MPQLSAPSIPFFFPKKIKYREASKPPISVESIISNVVLHIFKCKPPISGVIGQKQQIQTV